MQSKASLIVLGNASIALTLFRESKHSAIIEKLLKTWMQKSEPPMLVKSIGGSDD
jgi:hypothetical protein